MNIKIEGAKPRMNKINRRLSQDLVNINKLIIGSDKLWTNLLES